VLQPRSLFLYRKVADRNLVVFLFRWVLPFSPPVWIFLMLLFLKVLTVLWLAHQADGYRKFRTATISLSYVALKMTSYVSFRKTSERTAGAEFIKSSIRESRVVLNLPSFGNPLFKNPCGSRIDGRSFG
jgi:hypothetical protein